MIHQIHIRRAKPADARRISYLIRKNTDQVKENKYTPEQVATWKKQNTTTAILRQIKKRIVFCALLNDRLIGTIGLEGNQLVGLYISYTQRGKGLGKLLLSYAELNHRFIE